MQCAICYEPIYLFYYRGNCNCKIYYHTNCIKNWFEIKNTCAICNKLDNTDLDSIIRRHNRLKNHMFILLIFSFIIFIYSIKYYHLII